MILQEIGTNCISSPQQANTHENGSIQQAVITIDKCLQDDREVVDLVQKLGVSTPYSAVCSGMQDDDYPVHQLPLVTNVKRVPLPAELMEQFNYMQCNCVIGLFPEINRAWLTVDSDIFIWKYKQQADDLAYFDGLKETIISVALVKPKPGIFKAHVKYLLVLTTPLDVAILGVSFQSNDIDSDMYLLNEPLFSLPTDSTYFTTTVGTTNTGRIFSGGKDGCLYEIQYQAGSSWFGGNCRKVNHSRSRFSFLIPSAVSQLWINENDSIAQIVVDETRNILYTRSDKGSIGVFDLGVDGTTTARVALISLPTIQKRARQILTTSVEQSNLSELVTICPITLQQSKYLNLVAITQSGIRLYFVVSTLSIKQSKCRPDGLYLVHVRLPPGFTSSSVQRPASVHAANYQNGTLLLSSSNGDNATVWICNDHVHHNENRLKETIKQFNIEGRSWAVSQTLPSCEPPQLLMATLPNNKLSELPQDPPIQVTQHVQKPEEFVVVTSQGCHLFTKLRPVDQLRQILLENTNPENNVIKSFFKTYHSGEGVCCCIILMTSPSESNHITDRACQVFVRYGCSVSYNDSKTAINMNSGDQYPLSPIATNRTRIMHSGGPIAYSTPMPPVKQSFQQATFNTVPLETKGFLSERHHGLYKMFSRVVRPIWQTTIVEEAKISEEGRTRIYAKSRSSLEVVTAVLAEVQKLDNFIKKHCSQHATVKDSNQILQGHQTWMNSNHHEQHRKQMSELAQCELVCINLISSICDATIQILQLWKLCLYHQFHVIIANCDQTTRDSLKSTTFGELVKSGRQVFSQLVSSLISQHLNDNNTSVVGALSAQLRQICPDFYSPDDLACTQASELLKQARNSSQQKKKELFNEALKLLLTIAKSVDLPNVCQQLQNVQHYEGVIELCMKSALLKDENNLALHFHMSPHTVEELDNMDPAFKYAYSARKECYTCIERMLDYLISFSGTTPANPSIPTNIPSSQQALSGNLLNPHQAQISAESCLQKALASEDKLLHISLYNWMLNRNMNNQIIRVDSPFIESFLIEKSQETETSLLPSQLLCKYYEVNQMHLKAAKLKMKLAETPGSDRSLLERVELLALAAVHAKSMTSSSTMTSHQQLLKEVEDRLEVAKIQKEVLDKIGEDKNLHACQQLNQALYDVTTLYEEYAEVFNLDEVKLRIIAAAGETDQILIESLWQNIIEKMMLNSPNSSNEELISIIRQKIVQLSKVYADEVYFPLEFLVGFLEKLSMMNKWRKNWIPEALLETNSVSYLQLVDVYSQIHTKKYSHWSQLGDPHHILEVINEIVSLYLDNEQDIDYYGNTKRIFVSRCLDIIAQSLVHLQSVPNTSQILITSLQKNQKRLERL